MKRQLSKLDDEGYLMMFTVRKADSIRCLSFERAPSYPICLLCIHLWLPWSVETESVKLYFQRTRMLVCPASAFFSEHLLLLFVWVCLVLLCIAFPSTVSPALMDCSVLQARCFRRRPREARMLWCFSSPCPDPSVSVFHLAQEPGLWEVICQVLREVLGMP